MDRCAVFVDAGYLLAAGGLACCGTKHRAAFDCEYEALVGDLRQLATQSCNLSVLRIYWYDGAPDALPLADHLRIAHLADVKLRLGRLVRGEQKGVDSLIVRDLMTLARERAIATAYLVSGDEDIREGVAAAQDMGVRVTLVGVPVAGGQRHNQAPTLIREADEHIVLSVDLLRPHFAARQIPPPTISSDPQADEDVAREQGTSFGTQWAEGATTDELLELIGKQPTIPKELDVELLRAAEARLGALHDRHDVKKVLRQAFWDALQAARS